MATDSSDDVSVLSGLEIYVRTDGGADVPSSARVLAAKEERTSLGKKETRAVRALRLVTL
jgi:hypothetical protein